MNRRKKTPAGLVIVAIAATAVLTAISAFAASSDDWVYDTSQRVETPPTTAVGTMEGLDAKSRGLLATAGDTTVDKWYWTMDCSSECPVDRTPPGWMCIIR